MQGVPESSTRDGNNSKALNITQGRISTAMIIR